MDKIIVNFIKWLNRHNIKHELVNYGDNGYFYNADGYIYKAVTITIESEEVSGINPILTSIHKYTKRYNLDIMRECNRYTYNYVTYKYNYVVIVRTQENKKEIENYYYYKDKAVKECEELMHQYYINGTAETHNAERQQKMRAIMDYYGSLYNQSLIRSITA